MPQIADLGVEGTPPRLLSRDRQRVVTHETNLMELPAGNVNRPGAKAVDVLAGTSLFLTLWLALLLFPVEATAASLKSEALAAWNNYVQTSNANLQKRLQPGGSFLWTFEDADRAVRVRNGEIVVAPAPGPNPRKASGGLIHHWLGAMFLPNVKLDDIFEVTRNYDHYKDYYRPSVIESKTIARNGMEDEFSMLLMNKVLFLKSALDADYHSTNVRVDERRAYSISRTTRVQEIEGYGQPGEHRIPEGDGANYVWKIHDIVRVQQLDARRDPPCDGGVYYEFEAIALSREIPLALRFVGEPVVRRISRDWLITSLQNTRDAIRRNCVTSSRSAGIPATAKPGQFVETPGKTTSALPCDVSQ